MTSSDSKLPWGRFVIVGLLLALDLWSKSAVFEWLDRFDLPDGMVRDGHNHMRFPIAGDWLTFMISWNPGAAWGSLADYPYLLITGRVIATLLLSWMVIKTDRGQAVLLTALVLVLSGALGNLHDNLFLEPQRDHAFGSVRDFIDVYFGSMGWDYHFPTFNVADSCITCGAVLLLISGFFGSKKAEEEVAEIEAGESAETPLS